MTDGLHITFAALCTVALVAMVFAATADHWATAHNAYRLEVSE